MQHTEARPVGRPIDQAKNLAILNAARRLLFREGLRAFTVEAVAHAAGVSKVTVYARHGSREALLQAVIAQLARELSMAFDQHPGDSAALRASLIEFGRRLLKFIVSPAHVGLMRSLLGSGASSAPALRGVFRRGPAAMLQRVSAWLAECHGDGALHCPLPERSAETLLGMLQGLTLVRAMYGAVNAESKRDIEGHVSFAVDTFLRAHRVEPPRPSATRTAAPAGRTWAERGGLAQAAHMVASGVAARRIERARSSTVEVHGDRMPGRLRGISRVWPRGLAPLWSPLTGIKTASRLQRQTLPRTTLGIAT